MPEDEKLTRDDFSVYLEGLLKKEITDEFEIVIPPKITFEDMVDLVWLTYEAEREQLVGEGKEAEPEEVGGPTEPLQTEDEIEVPPSPGKAKGSLFTAETLAALPTLLAEAGRPLLSSELRDLFVKRGLCPDTQNLKRKVVLASFRANEQLVERRRSSWKTEGDVGGKGRGEYVYSLRT